MINDKDREELLEAIEVLKTINQNSTKEEVLIAMKEHPIMGPILPLLNKELRGDKEVVLEAMKLNINQFRYVSEELQHDEGFVADVSKVIEEELQDIAKSTGQTFNKDELAKLIARKLRPSDVKKVIEETEQIARNNTEKVNTTDTKEVEI